MTQYMFANEAIQACVRVKFRAALWIAMVSAAVVITGSGTAQAACTVPTLMYPTIQSAVNDVTCNPINVLMGSYPEDVTIPRTVVLAGAQDGAPVSTRVFAGPLESTVHGLITIQAANVTIDGFSITNSVSNVFQNNGILIKTAGDSAFITNNIISAVGTLSLSSNAQGIYLENGPDNVRIVANEISLIQSAPSAKGIYVGDTAATNPSTNTLISDNLIANIRSGTRGAYGIQVNNRAGQPDLVIWNNTIRDLNGVGWAHAVGLERDTLRVLVRRNSIRNVLSPTADRLAVWFEDNPSFATGHVNENNLDVTIADYGIAVQPTLPAGPVDGTCNWWGDASGPGPVGPGIGAMVSPKVDYTPWLIAPAPGGPCAGSTPGKATGGGQIESDPIFSPLGELVSLPAIVPSLSDPNGGATFGFNAKCCPTTGNLEYNDHPAEVRIKAQFVDGFVITSPGVACPATPGSKHAQFTGMAAVTSPTGTTNERFTVDVDDCGEPGTADTFGIRVDTYSNGPSTLIGGNIQIH